MINRILVMTDFSDSSVNALKYALTLAAALEAKVQVLHVDQLPYLVSTPPFNLYKYYQETRDKDVQKNFQNLEKKLKASGVENLKYSTSFTEGFTYDEMDKFIKKENIDLCVVGATGKSATEQLLMGSTTSEIARKIEIPLMVIPEKVSFKPYKKIAYATDNHAPEFQNVAKLFFMAEKFDSHLDVVHVKTEEDKKLPKTENYFKKNKSKISYKKWKFTPLKETNIITAINEFLKKEKTDLLIMSRHHRTFFNRLFHISISKKMVFNTKIPFLILNE